MGWAGVVCIATHYGLDGQGLNPGRGKILHTHPDQPWGPSNLLYNAYCIIPGGKAAWVWH
jgi:hypothetical protein